VALRISITRPSKPPTATSSETSVPIVYVTDADCCFGTAVEAFRLGCFAGQVAPAVVVGIGYADETGDYSFAGRRRGLDFYSGDKRELRVPGMGALTLGGADDFLDALLQHVFPEIERREPLADPKRRFLFGASAGGHFAAYALSREPKAFAGFALMSPVLRQFPPSPGVDEMIDAVAALPAGAIAPSVRVFLSAGSEEETPGDPLAGFTIISNVYRMRALLAAKGVATELAIFAGEDHISVPGAAIARAFRFLLPTKASAETWQGALKAATA
jgi:predicted alpha/beta superfamily hydrolase